MGLNKIYNSQQLSCIIFLLLTLNPFLHFPHADSSSPSPLDFLRTLTNTRKGATAKGLSKLKTYLSRFGYMNANTDAQDTDLFDDALEQAITSYQKFFKLTINGFLDEQTVAKLMKPRCGVRDFPRGNKTETHGQNPNIDASHFSFFPDAPKWPPNKRNLTYSFPPGTIAEAIQAIKNASQLWADVSSFTFAYVSNYDQADIKISFEVRDHGDGHAFDGPSGVLGHAFAPTDGRVHFDGDEKWVDGVVPGSFDLQSVGLHELGHVLGLGHSDDGDATMSPYIGDGFRKVLNQDDINGIKELYK